MLGVRLPQFVDVAQAPGHGTGRDARATGRLDVDRGVAHETGLGRGHAGSLDQAQQSLGIGLGPRHLVAADGVREAVRDREATEDRIGEDARLVRQHGEPLAAARECLEQGIDAPVKARVIEQAPTVVVAEALARGIDEFVLAPGRCRGETRDQEASHAVADEADHALVGKLGESEVAQRAVHGGGQVPARVDEGPVEVEDEVSVGAEFGAG